MSGYHAPLVPGWDCHGLPIELKVTAELGIERTRESVDRVSFKKYCRDYASKWIAIQREELKDMGKLADYDHAYLTMSKQYESDILRAFALFVEKGYIERKGKAVPWCASCQTVLAAAEIEYKDRKDPAIYVFFPVQDQTAKLVFPYVFEQNSNLKLGFLVWTTTPWTLPLNRAVVLNPTAKYVIIQGKTPDEAYIVGKDLSGQICSMLNIEKNILCEFDPDVFAGKKVNHPFIPGLQVPVLTGDLVTTTDGTACLHCAPGCGLEDYMFGVKSGLEVYSPLSSAGKYTYGIKPEELDGMPIVDGQIWVIRKLAELGHLVHKQSVTHSYPHCWRCRNGLMFRATDQWFCDLQKNELVQKTLKEIDNINFIPDWGKNRLMAFTATRTEWCISRQRVWGTPIPALLCECCDNAFINAQFVRAVADNVEKEGIEYWDRVSIQDLLDAGIIHKDIKCAKCGNSDLKKFKKEQDILDVWFDSGASFFAVLEREPEKLGVPADLYLEGSDQHRGWFQSSLLCSMVINGCTQTKGILTHGYVVDENKAKMSKSLGNGIEPQDIVKKYSRDILRLWVASADFEGDVVISEKLLCNVSEMYKKIRNTCRFLISNLYDFDMAKDGVAFKDMLAIDQYAMAKLIEIDKTVRDAYDNYKFSLVVSTLNNYCATYLSALYLDISKDRLYVEQADGNLRRSVQTVLYHNLDTLARLMAPILSFLAEEVSDFYQKNKTESIHLQNFVSPTIMQNYASEIPDGLIAEGVNGITKHVFDLGINLGDWALLEAVRDAVLKSIEPLREKGAVKHSLEAKVTLHISNLADDGKQVLAFIDKLAKKEDVNRFFKDWFIVSQVEFVHDNKNLGATDLAWLHVKIEHAHGNKCMRCWQWGVPDNADQVMAAQLQAYQLCQRCCDVLKK
jgi:isoleucyl-tRNA synthetase